MSTRAGTLLLGPAILALSGRRPAAPAPVISVVDPVSTLPEPWRTTIRSTLRDCCGTTPVAGCTSGFVAAMAGSMRAIGRADVAAILDRCAERRRAAEKLAGPSPGDEWDNGRKLAMLDCKIKFRRDVRGTSHYFQEGYGVGLASAGCRSWT